MKIFITGGTGFIGRHLIELWKNAAHEITIVARTIDASLFPKNINCKSIDITDEKAIKAAIILAEPDVVIHSAAMSKPNDCEIQKELCNLINVKASQYIIDACKTIEARLIFMSTDFVFGHNGPYTETDTYCPVNYYGESKVLAEKLVLDSGLHFAIVRTVMVYGKKLEGQNNTFLHWVKDNLQQLKVIKVFTDQYRSVTYVNDLCKGIDSIVYKGFHGIVHLCGETIFTPFELAQKVADYFGFDKKLVAAVTKETFPEAAVRPENSVLVIDKARQELDYVATPLHNALPQIFG
jgi:dTDP-4-dehydrorhamnose reductase